MSIQLEGAEEILERLEKLQDTEKFEKAVGLACALVEASAKEKAPVKKGELRRSITSKVDGLEGIVYSPLEYAPYVEYGTGLFAEDGGRSDVPWHYQDEKGEWHSTSGQQPQPFMRPALDENRDEILQLLWEGVLND